MCGVQSLASDFHCAAGRAASLLGEHMQHEWAATLDGGIDGASDAVAALHPHLPELALQWADVRQANALRTKVLQHFSDV